MLVKLPPDEKVEIEEPFTAKGVAPGAKEERADNGKEVIHDALVDTKLCNFVLCKLFD